MESILMSFVIIIGVIVVTSIINEKKLHIQHDIALVSFSFLISFIILLLQKFGIFHFNETILEHLTNTSLDNFLLECTLCFMLFAGASKIHLNKFLKNVIPIASLAIVTTAVSSIVYGLLFYIVNLLLNLNISIWTCMILGALLSPTDPAAATENLNKHGISKSLISVIEGESMFNDGLAVTLFVFFKGIVTTGTGGNILIILAKEILGAVAVGVAISFLMHKVLRQSNDPIMHILISLLDVSLCYVICEEFGFSGVISSVVCGLYFSYQDKKIVRWKEVVDPKELYLDFWNIIGNLLNSMLFVLVGFSVLSMEINKMIFILIPVAIILNLIARCTGVSASTLLIGKKNIPSKYNKKEFISLLTWGGLRGGVSLALALTMGEFLLPFDFTIVINMILVTILFTTIIQGSIIGKIYKFIESKREKKYSERSLKVI